MRCKTGAGRRYDHEDWQIETMNGVLYCVNHRIREILVIRARGGSKTHDMMCVCLYFAYIGYRVIYFCSTASQMEQPKKYLRSIVEGSFLKYCVKKPHREFFQKTAVYFEFRGYIEIKNLTDDNARSPRCDVVLFDEEAKAEVDAFMAAESILEGSDLAITIHSSTPVKATIFEENYDRLHKREVLAGETKIFMRKWHEIGFLAQYPERYEEKKAKQPLWFFRQENLCSFELPSGAVFRNVIYEPYPDWLQEEISDLNDISGVDWNPAAGHAKCSVRWIPKKKIIAVTHEDILFNGYTHELKSKEFWALVPWFTKGNSIVLEDGGINIGFIKWFRDMLSETELNHPQQDWTTEEWDSQGINKMEAITWLYQNGITIYVDKLRFPEVAKQIEECHFDPDAKGDPKIAKDPANSPHFLDGFLHTLSKCRRETVFTFGEWR